MSTTSGPTSVFDMTATITLRTAKTSITCSSATLTKGATKYTTSKNGFSTLIVTSTLCKDFHPDQPIHRKILRQNNQPNQIQTCQTFPTIHSLNLQNCQILQLTIPHRIIIVTQPLTICLMHRLSRLKDG